MGRDPSPSTPSQCVAALWGRPCCTAAQQARCTAAKTLPSSRKRTSRLAGCTLTSTAAGSRRTVTTPKGWRPAGSRPRYASSTATPTARLWTRRRLTPRTTPARPAPSPRPGDAGAPGRGPAAEAGAGRPPEAAAPADLRGGMARDGEGQLGGGDALAVVADADAHHAALLHLDVDASRAGVEG